MITQFALRLILGMSAVWCVMPRRDVASGFFRIQNLVTLGLAVLAAVAAGQMPAVFGAGALLATGSLQWAAWLLAAGAFAGSVMWTLERRCGATQLAFAITAGTLATTIGGCVAGAELVSLYGALYWLTEVATGLVSGAAVGGMLLGHWYLTAPAMSTAPLNRVNAWLGSVATVRLLLGVLGVCLLWPQVKVLNATHLIWLSLLWLGGIIGPLIVCVMVQRIMKYRNTQAATGVLFVGVILAFIGEMTGALLRREVQLPL